MSQRDLSPEEAAARWLARQRVDKSDQTVASYRYRLDRFLEWCDEAGVDSMRELDGWLLDEFEAHRRGRGVAPITLQNELSTFRLLVEYCEDLGVIEEGLHEKIKPPSIDANEERSDKRLSIDRASRLISAFRTGDQPGSYGRPHAFLELAWFTAARIGGIRSLDVDDLDLDAGIISFNHRPDQGTPLKKGVDGERKVLLPDAKTATVLRRYLRDRIDVIDQYGRRPLFSTSQGRASMTTIRKACYYGTLWCRVRDCPHGERQPECEFWSKHSASGCPSAVNPHAIRSGSITWHRNEGWAADELADRVNATTQTIERYYDLAADDERIDERRAQYAKK